MDDDPYLWLEDVTGDTALDWVRERNAETVDELTGSGRFVTLRAELRQVLDADDRIPYPRRRGKWLYNFWQDADHPRGLWRRTTLKEYRRERPSWEIILDVDALAAEEGENWVWQGAAVLRPGYRLALVELSRGGADAVVVREFDITKRSFVDGGFELPEAKTHVSWIDADTIYVGTDFGEDSMTASGYPRIVKQWRRGTPLAEATTLFEGKPDDVSVSGYHDHTEGFERGFIARNLDFWRSEKYLRADELIRIDVPDDAEIDVHREWLLITLRSDWLGHPAGALLAAPFDDFLAGQRELTVLFEPDEHSALSYHAWTRHHLIIASLVDVRCRLEVRTPGPDGWSRAELAEVPELASAGIVGTDPDRSDEYFLDVSGYTQPATLRRGEIGGPVETVKQAPAFFDAGGLTVRQHFAESADGTQVPYFVVGPDTPGPTLLTGYGGYEVSETPGYSGVLGRGWLSRGGTYVVANIRGGGEYGPRWHQAAMKANRVKVYEDFAAVARDLVARGITTPARLGIEGASNGGLLMGVMLTRHPELFGAVVGQVPLLDMLRYHRLLAGASWMAEYGDPDDPEERVHLAEYSPYHSIHTVHSGQLYPPVLWVTSTRDDRVHPGHARKMTARLRELGHPVRLYENIEGGHGAAADNEQVAFKWALIYEFLWRELA